MGTTKDYACQIIFTTYFRKPQFPSSEGFIIQVGIGQYVNAGAEGKVH